MWTYWIVVKDTQTGNSVRFDMPNVETMIDCSIKLQSIVTTGFVIYCYRECVTKWEG